MAYLIDFEFKHSYLLGWELQQENYFKRQPLLNQSIVANGNIIAGIEAKE